MKSDTYQNLSEYYQSQAWAAKRTARLKLDGFKCAKCGFTRALEVHHINYDRLYHEDVSRDLITLCKKCHGEIESQKNALNPIPKPVEHHSVYLAGKIRPWDWRHRFCNVSTPTPEDIASGYEVKASNELTITGPFFISCDHGCYHGDGQHGIGAKNGGCMGDYYTRDDVLRICKEQIDKAEIVLAYIDAWDCYGTVAEIGYAHAAGKDIFIVFESDCFKEDMWFIDKMQRNTGIASDEWIKEQLTSRFKEEK